MASSRKRQLWRNSLPGSRCLLAILMVVAMAVASCRNTDQKSLLKIGLSEQPRTLNIWLASDANSKKVLSQIYQPLYIKDPVNLETIPWLAADLPRFDPDANTYTIKLRPARWSDGVPLNAADVAFTGRMIKAFKIPRFASKWEPVERIEATDDKTVVFHMNRPYANFMDGTLSTPVVPEHQWGPLAEKARRSEKPLAALLKQRITTPIGNGPFVLEKQDRGTYLYLRKNPYFFANGLTIGGRLMGPYLDGLLFKIYGTTDVAVLALKKGDIDIFWSGIQPGYLSSLRQTSHIEVITSQRSAIYFLGFNLRRPPFDDVNLRKAVGLLIDKAFIVNRILQGSGAGAGSIIPAGNHLWSHPDVSLYGQGLPREDRIRKAVALLSAAGYRWQVSPVDSHQAIRKPTAMLLQDGNPMPEITILTPPADYDPHRAMAGMMIQEWLRDVGIPAKARPMSFGALLSKVKARHDFQAFVLGYGRLSLDPDYLRTFFHSKNAGPRGWNMSGYSRPDFDRLADLSQRETDPQSRQQLVYQMQDMISEDMPYIPLYTPELVEAVRTDRFSGWVAMLEGIGNRWSFCQLKPVEAATGEGKR